MAASRNGFNIAFPIEPNEFRVQCSQYIIWLTGGLTGILQSGTTVS
jgi:hypothetical protein